MAACGCVSVLFALGALLILLPSAFSQAAPDFSLTATALSPNAVGPLGTSSSTISVGAVNGFIGTVGLSCLVTPKQTSTSPPVCTVSPTTVTVPGDASATITTSSDTSPGAYSITITGTGPSTTHTTPSESLTVLSLTPQFTITVLTTVSPPSVPAGQSGQATVSVNPIFGYTSPKGAATGVTLACSSITPLVVSPPYCSFSYPPGHSSLPVSGEPATSTLTIGSWGPFIQNAGVNYGRRFYALWLPLPMLGLVGVGAATGGKRARKAWVLLALFVVSGTLLLVPACGNTSTQTALQNGALTPNNTYTFTIIGVDGDGVVSSNAGANASGPTVTMTVTTATQ